MKLPEVRSLVQSMVDGLKTTSGSIFNPKMIDKALVPYRAEIAGRNYKRDGGLHDIWYQDWNLIIDPDLQANAPKNAIVFRIPLWVKLSHFDGLGYVGSKDFMDRWVRIKNPMHLSNMQLDPVSAICNNPDTTYYMPNLATRQLIVWNNPIDQEGTAHMVAADPCDFCVLGQMYNKETDDYPMSVDDIVEAIELLKKDLLEGKALTPNIKMNQPSGEAEHPFKLNTGQQQTQQ